MLLSDDEITGIDYDEELETVVVRTARKTNYEEKLSKKTRTSGCAVGTVFGDMMEGLEHLTLPATPLKTSWLYALAHQINQTPSLYLEAGAIHGTVLCEKDQPLVYMEDVGRHNAVDKIAGWMRLNAIEASDKILYTTGRLTSEMVIKTASMGIPALASRSGFTAWGVDIARQVGLTLIGRMRGSDLFVCQVRNGFCGMRIWTMFRMNPKKIVERDPQDEFTCWGHPCRWAGNPYGRGDKGRLMLGQQSLLEHVIDRLRPQVSSIILNANGPKERFSDLNFPVVADGCTDMRAPLQVCLQGWIGLLKMVQSLL